MNELSLFSGAGGGLLGTKLLGFKHIGYVEYDEYCQKVLKQRIKDGFLDPAPIFGDIRKFISEGYAGAYKGMVDVITAGFPCPDFSVAGKQKGSEGERNFWPETWDCIRIIRPNFVFLENVPGLLVSRVQVESEMSIPYFGSILGDLAESGYDARWCVFGASDVGANHHRKRLWVLANTRLSGQKEHEVKTTGIEQCGEKVSDSSSPGLERCVDKKRSIARHNWWEVEPRMGRVVDGIPGRVDMLKALGNAQVPAVVAEVWKILKKGLTNI